MTKALLTSVKAITSFRKSIQIQIRQNGKSRKQNRYRKTSQTMERIKKNLGLV
jgi:hypothetical protein